MITPQFSFEDVEAEINKQINERKSQIIHTLEYVGKQCVNDAVKNRGYTDQTGNLKASIGYMILDDGRVVSKPFFPESSENNIGSQTSKAFLNSIIAENSTGIVLIVVAGMNYAAYVEAMGKNVLTSAELLAERIVPTLLKKIGLVQ